MSDRLITFLTFLGLALLFVYGWLVYTFDTFFIIVGTIGIVLLFGVLLYAWRQSIQLDRLFKKFPNLDLDTWNILSKLDWHKWEAKYIGYIVLGAMLIILTQWVGFIGLSDRIRADGVLQGQLQGQSVGYAKGRALCFSALRANFCYNNGVVDGKNAQAKLDTLAQATAVAQQTKVDSSAQATAVANAAKQGYDQGVNKTLNGFCPLLPKPKLAPSSGYFLIASESAVTACYGILHTDGYLQRNSGPEKSPYGFLVPVESGAALVRAQQGALVGFFPDLKSAKTQCGKGFDINIESNQYLC